MAMEYDGWWFWIVIVLALIFWDDVWYSRWAYELWYSIPSDQVSLEAQPHDCDFLKAPIGEKECHYKRVVSTVEFASSQNNTPIVSYDGGKTWSGFMPDPGTRVPRNPTVVSVSVSWEKVED